MAGVVVVTGAAGVLGGAIVRELVGEGARVAAVGSGRSGGELDALAKELGERCLAVTLDVTGGAAWKEALGRIEGSLGAVDGAVLAAGGFRWTGALHEAEDDAWEAMWRINAETAERSLRAVLPGMVARGRGRVVLVAARPAERPWMGAGMAAYTASKAAVLGLAGAVAAEVRDHGVTVNTVLPSIFDTPRNRADMPDVDFSRWVAPESLAKVVAFLLSEGARDISGAQIPVYGRA